MNRGLLALLGLLVALALGAGWWLLEGGGAVDRRGEPLGSAPRVEAPASALPAPIDGAEPVPTELSPLAGGDPRDPVAAPEPELPFFPRRSGTIRGQLVDVAGQPIPDEPVLLAADRDAAFADGVSRRPTRLGEILARERSDAEGRFRLEAQPGIAHALQVGGRVAAPRLVREVHAGAQLLLELDDGLAFEGVVIAEETGEPIPGAVVGAFSDTQHMLGYADAEGRFRLAPLPDLAHFLGAWAPGYDVLSEFGAPGLGEQTLSLPPGRAVAGHVRDSLDDAPLADVEVRLRMQIEARLSGAETLDEPNRDVHEVVELTDAEGAFVFTGTASQGFELLVAAEGYRPLLQKRWSDRALGEEELVELLLERLPAIEVLVLDGLTRRALSGAEVELSGPDEVLQRATSDEDGRVTLDFGTWDGRDRVHVTARDAAGRTARTRVRPDKGDAQLTLELLEPASLVVRTTLDGQPVADVEVRAKSPQALPSFALSDADGLASLVHELAEPSDTLRLVARRGDLQSLSVEVALPRRNSEPVELALDLGAHITGRVIDEDGAPIPGARVATPKVVRGHADPEGVFRIGPFPQGEARNLRIDAEHFRGQILGGVLPGGEELLIVLEPVRVWSGLVLDGLDEQPVDAFAGRLQVEVQDEAGLWVFKNAKERVGPDGREAGHFSVPMPGPGRFRLRLGSSESLLTNSLPIDFDGLSDPPEVEIVLSPAAVLEVLVEDASGRPMPGLRLALFRWEELSAWENAVGKQRRKLRKRAYEQRTNGAGVARFKLGEGGEYALVQADLGRRLGGKLSVLPGPVYEKRVSWGWSGDLQVQVRGPTGLDVPGARISLTLAENGAMRRSASADEGGALFEQLLPGRYRLQANARGYATQVDEVDVGAGAVGQHTVLFQEGSGGSERERRKPTRAAVSKRSLGVGSKR